MVRYCCAELISIHAPRTGSDCKSRSKRLSKRTFQSTLPARGATDPLTNVAISCGSISIHAPRTGSDRNTSHTISTQEHFNPRSPHGERLKYQRDVNIVIKFQSTLPARGATKARAQRWNRLVISIHAPRTGSDILLFSSKAAFFYFNPRSPHGERRIHTSAHLQANSKFQSTLPARGATNCTSWGCYLQRNFNPRSPHGERRYRAKTTAARMKHFNPRSPHGERRPRMVASSAARNFNPRSPHGERPLNAYGITETKAFQSTLPARGATYRAKTTAARMKHFNPRSPHGERLGSLAMQLEYL